LSPNTSADGEAAGAGVGLAFTAGLPLGGAGGLAEVLGESAGAVGRAGDPVEVGGVVDERGDAAKRAQDLGQLPAVALGQAAEDLGGVGAVPLVGGGVVAGFGGRVVVVAGGVPAAGARGDVAVNAWVWAVQTLVREPSGRRRAA
jgi:hypothetical protein